MLGILFAGLGLWAWYGFLKDDWIIILSNCFSFLINLVLAYFTLKYKSGANKKKLGRGNGRRT
jgi:MtN3 and saliva related transmembrane protein